MTVSLSLADVPKFNYDFRINSKYLAPHGYNPPTYAILPGMLNFETNTSFSSNDHEGNRWIPYAVDHSQGHYDENVFGLLTIKRVSSVETVSPNSNDYSRVDTYEGTFSGAGGFKEKGDYSPWPGYTYDAQAEWTHSYHLSFVVVWSLTQNGALASWIGIDTAQPFTIHRCMSLQRYDNQGAFIYEEEGCHDWTETSQGVIYQDMFQYHIVRTIHGGWKMFIHHDFAFDVCYEFDLVNNSIKIPDGAIKVRLVNALPADVYDGIDKAHVTLYRQDGFIRERANGETAQEYQDFLKTRNLVQEGTFYLQEQNNSVTEFQDLALFERAVGSGPGAYAPAYYTIEVSSAETEETDINQDPVDPAFTTTTIFSSRTVRNIRPTPQIDTIPTPETIVELDPADVFISKLAIIEALAVASPNNYNQIEINDALPWVISLKNGVPSDAQIEALKRVLWAERVVRDGYVFADLASELMLGGLATVFADAFDDLTDFTRNDIKTGKEQLQKIKDGKSVPTTFYDKTALPVENYFPNMGLYQVIKDGEKAGMIKQMLKTTKLLIYNAADKAGLSNENAKRAANIMHDILKTILSSVQTQTLKGAAKPLIKNLIAFAINETQPLIMDGTLLGSYCGDTKSYLQVAVDTAQTWNLVDEARYLQDRRQVVDTIRQMGNDASSVLSAGIILQGLGEGLDASQDAFALFGNALKQLKVAEKVAMAGKYLSNTSSIVLPTILLVHTLPEAVKNGTYHAYGTTPQPNNSMNMADVQATEIYARGGGNYNALNSDIADLKVVLEALQNLLATDQVADAIVLAADNLSPTSYVSKLNAFNENYSLFLTKINALQPTGASSNLASALSDLMLFDSELKAAQIRFIVRLREFFLAIELAEYLNADDPTYLRKRDALTGQIPPLIESIDNLQSAIYSSDFYAHNQPLAQVVAMEILSLSSEATGGKTITQTPETFKLDTRITNLSSSQLSNLSSLLTVNSNNLSIAMISSNELPCGSGTLAPGADAVVSWRFTYDGDLSNELIKFNLTMLENGIAPSSFDFNEPETQIIIDPSQSDKDGDLLPDSWEKSYGIAQNQDSANDDPDIDGLITLDEYRLRTNPIVADSDGDNLNDGEEVTGGSDGFQTDPLNPDTDGDGINDDLDGQPLDASTTGSGDQLGEGSITLSTNVVVLSSAALTSGVQVTNSGTGPLTWTAAADDYSVVTVVPTVPSIHGGEGELSIMVPHHYDLSRPWSANTTITVRNFAGTTNDSKTISVLVVGDGSVSDTDKDGTIDLYDQYPFDPTESADADGDGIGDNADPDDDNDQIPDSYELANNLDPLDPNDAGLDADGDGYSNLAEYLAGTNIHDPNSNPSIKPSISPVLFLLLSK